MKIILSYQILKWLFPLLTLAHTAAVSHFGVTICMYECALCSRHEKDLTKIFCSINLLRELVYLVLIPVDLKIKRKHVNPVWKMAFSQSNTYSAFAVFITPMFWKTTETKENITGQVVYFLLCRGENKYSVNELHPHTFDLRGTIPWNDLHFYT